MKSTGALSQNTNKTKKKGTLWPADEIEVFEPVIHPIADDMYRPVYTKEALLKHCIMKLSGMELFDGHCLTFMLSINKTLMRIGMSHA